MCTQLSCGKDATRAQENKLANLLTPEQIPQIKSAKFVSKADALKIMQKKSHELTRQLPGNPLPDAFEIMPKHGEDVALIASKIPTGAGVGVEKVTYGKKTAKRILRVARVIEIVFLLAVIVLLTATALLIANTIRLSIFSPRREIEVMKLVGATNWFVRGPFMLEGLTCGLVGSLLPVVLLMIAKEAARRGSLGRRHRPRLRTPGARHAVLPSRAGRRPLPAERRGDPPRGARPVHRVPRPDAVPAVDARDALELLRDRRRAASGTRRP